jgi:hypothetical protein
MFRNPIPIIKKTPMIPAGWSELAKAFRQHISIAKDGTSPSHNLLMFYAVECGLKSIYLQRNHFKTIEQIPDESLQRSHDLARWVKELRLPASTTGKTRGFHLQRDRSSSWQVDMAHQAWRYGVAVEVSDEKALVDWLKRIQQWIEENI